MIESMPLLASILLLGPLSVHSSQLPIKYDLPPDHPPLINFDAHKWTPHMKYFAPGASWQPRFSLDLDIKLKYTTILETDHILYHVFSYFDE